MKTKVKTALLSVIGTWIVLMGASCRNEPGPSDTMSEVASGRNPNSSIGGTVTYRERLALTPGATLIVELWDVSYADSPAPLIARQTISGPGQVPIKFKVEYNREDISSRNRYSTDFHRRKAEAPLKRCHSYGLSHPIQPDFHVVMSTFSTSPCRRP